MAPDEHLLSLLPELGASVTVPSFSNWVADVAVPAATGALAWSCLQVAVYGIF